MAQTIKLKRSSTQGKVPTTSQLALGEIAINTYDGRIFFEKNDGSATIEHIVTTDSITTGSITITGTTQTGTLTTTNRIDKQYLDDEVLNTSLNTFTGSAITITGNGTSGSVAVFNNTHEVTNASINSLDSGTTITHDNDTNIIFTISGSNGELLTVTDSNSGNLLEVNDSSGIDVFTVSATGDVSASGAITASGVTGLTSLTVAGTTQTTTLTTTNRIDKQYLDDEVLNTSLNAATGSYLTEHPSISQGSNISQNNSNGTVIQDLTITLDSNGHVTTATAGTVNLDGRYYTETESDTLYTKKLGQGVISGSSQVLDILTSLNSATGSYLTTVDISSDTNLGVSDTSEVNMILSGDTLSAELIGGVVSGSSQVLGILTSLNAATGSYLTAHPNISAGSNISQNNSNGTVLQDLAITLDSNGHVTTATAGTINLDGRYYTETESDTLFTKKLGQGIVSGSSQVLDILTSLNSATGSYLTTVDISSDTNLAVSDTAEVNMILSGDTLSAELIGGVVSGSSQVLGILTSLNSATGSYATGDNFDEDGTFTSLRAQGTTADDVGLGNVTNESKSTMFTSPTFTGTTAAPTPSANDNSTKIATTAYVQTELTDLVGNAPAAFDTLGEISASLAADSGALDSLTTVVSGKLQKDQNLSDLTNVSTARSNLGVDEAGTDNSTDVTLAGSRNYITISGQTITRNVVDISDDTNLAVSDTSEVNMILSGDTLSAELIGGVVSGSSQVLDILTSLNAATSSYLTEHPSITQGSNISQNNSNGTVLQDLTITLDSNGHVTTATAGTINLDGRYYTETEIDNFGYGTGSVTNVTVGTGLDISTGTTTPAISLDLTEITLGAGLDSTATGLSLDLSELTDMTADVVGSADELILLDNGAERRKAINEIKLSQFNNDSGFLTSVDISSDTNLTGGAGLTLTGDDMAVDYSTNSDNVVAGASTGTPTNSSTILFADTGGVNKVALSSLNISHLNNNSGFGTGSVTNVTVGTGLDVSTATTVPNITLDLSELTDMTANVVGTQDELILLDNGAERRKLISEITLSDFNNDSGFLTSVDLTSDVTGVLPSANLDSDTAHLSGTQTFTGAKTFTGDSKFTGQTNFQIMGDSNAIFMSSSATYDPSNDVGKLYVGGYQNGNTRINGLVFDYAEPAVMLDLDIKSTDKIETTNTTQSTSKTTGAVTISGGVGIAKTLNVGEDVVAYASSDERYKDFITPIENPNEKIKLLSGNTFVWNDKHEVFKGKKDIGVIAQEVEKVLPEIVETRDNGYKAVKYEKIVALLIESNKELIKRVEELESKIK